MIVQTAQRLLTLCVLGFAAMGFLAVPLGDKTGFEYTRDFLSSDEAKIAGEEVSRSISEAKEQLEHELAERNAGRSELVTEQ